MRYIPIVIIVLFLLAGCGTVDTPAENVDSFEDCINAGNPAMESYPRQCRHEDRTFTEEIDSPVEPPEKPIGGERDEHGCLPAAGYQWCESTQECQRFWEDPCPEEEMILPDEDAMDTAVEHVLGMSAYADHNGRDIFAGNVQVLKCPGCFDVEVIFERDSVKTSGGTTRAIMHVMLKDWEVDDVTARYEEIS